MAIRGLANRRLQPLGHLSGARRQASLAGLSACVAKAGVEMGIDRANTGQGRRSPGWAAWRSNMSRGRDDRPNAVFAAASPLWSARASALLTSHWCGHNQEVQDARIVAEPEANT